MSDLKDGTNFRVIQGKHAGSKLIVNGKFSYRISKSEYNRGSQEVVHYLVCKYGPCLAKAVIKTNTLEMSASQSHHTCDVDCGASTAKITAAKLLTKMKTRAANEGTTFSVSIISI